MFSAIVGFSAILNPLANYLLRYYTVAVATLWATTFSLAVLFIPKLYIFYKQWKDDKQKLQEKQRKESSYSDKTLTSASAPVPEDVDITFDTFLKEDQAQQNEVTFQPTRLIAPFLYEEPALVHPTANPIANNTDTNDASLQEGRYDNTNVYVEVQEVVFI